MSAVRLHPPSIQMELAVSYICVNGERSRQSTKIEIYFDLPIEV
jgi:hypothetical protein